MKHLLQSRLLGSTDAPTAEHLKKLIAAMVTCIYGNFQLPLDIEGLKETFHHPVGLPLLNPYRSQIPGVQTLLYLRWLQNIFALFRLQPQPPTLRTLLEPTPPVINALHKALSTYESFKMDKFPEAAKLQQEVDDIKFHTEQLRSRKAAVMERLDHLELPTDESRSRVKYERALAARNCGLEREKDEEAILHSLQRQLADLRDEEDTATNALEETVARVAECRRRLTSLEQSQSAIQQCDSLEEQKAAQDAERSALRRKYRALALRLKYAAHVAEQAGLYKAAAAKLQTNKNELQTALKRSQVEQRQGDEAQRRLQRKQTDLESSRKKLADLMAKSEELRNTQNDAAQRQLNAANAERAKLRELQTAKQTLRDQVRRLRETNTSLDEEKQRLIARRDELRTRDREVSKDFECFEEWLQTAIVDFAAELKRVVLLE